MTRGHFYPGDPVPLTGDLEIRSVPGKSTRVSRYDR